jgi:mono/diheme cytochrome c family protein
MQGRRFVSNPASSIWIARPLTLLTMRERMPVRLALEVCANCHVVSADQGRAPILNPPAPAFVEIAGRPEVTEASLRKFLSEPHGETHRNSAMPAFLLSASQVEGVVAYLLSRKPK